MEDFKNKCYHSETQKFIDSQNPEHRNENIVSLLERMGCNYCSGNDYECENYLSVSEFYSKRGCGVQ